MSARFEGINDVVDGAPQELVHNLLKQAGLQLDLNRNADATAGWARGNDQPGQTELAERHVGRGDVERTGPNPTTCSHSRGWTRVSESAPKPNPSSIGENIRCPLPGQTPARN